MLLNSEIQLVVTAIGEDKPGMVSKLTQMVSETNCNIIDSRIAIMGNEFSFIMLLEGDLAAISRVEYLLPSLGVELGLLTMMKRTQKNKQKNYSAGYTLAYSGPDKPGTLSKVTRIMAEHQVNIAALKSDTIEQDTIEIMRSELEINVTEAVDICRFKLELENLFAELGVEHILKRIR